MQNIKFWKKHDAFEIALLFTKKMNFNEIIITIIINNIFMITFVIIINNGFYN